MQKQARQKRVQPVGAYGFNNFGDELFVSTIQENASRIWPGAKVETFVISSCFYSSPKWWGKMTRLCSAIYGFLWADTIAFCGGSTLEDVRGIDKLRQRFLKYRNVEALGVSIGPFDSNVAGRRVRKTTKNIRRMAVRDQRSIARLHAIHPEAHASVGGDLVALSNQTQVIDPGARAGITICPSAAAGVPDNILAELVMEALDTYVSETGQKPQVTLLALSQHPTSNDIPLCSILQHELLEAGYDANVCSFVDLGLAETCAVIAKSHMVWTYRLHGAVVAYLSKVPFLVVGHHAKCIDFADDIGMAEAVVLPAATSWNDTIVSILNGDKPSFSPEDYRERAREIYLNYPGPAARSAQ